MVKNKTEDEVVTRKLLDEAVDAILKGMQKISDDTNSKIDKLDEKEDKRHIETQEQVGNLDEKVSISDRIVNSKIKAIKTSLVTRNEFEALKREVSLLKKEFASS